MWNIGNEKKEEHFSSLRKWLSEEEVVHIKLNSLLVLVESIEAEEVAIFSKRLSTVLREQLLILDSQVKENLLKRI